MANQFKKFFQQYLDKKKIYIIAEAGVNHDGKISKAKKLIEMAKKAGANAIKFQTFTANDVVTKKAKKAKYQISNTKKQGSQYEMIKNLELQHKDFIYLKKIAEKNKIDFICSIFDNESLRFISLDLKSPIIKIPSGEITNYLLLKEIDYKKNYIFLSTGMSNMREVVDAINCICKSKVFVIKSKKITILNKKLYNTVKKKLFIFHCVTDYPVEEKFANLNCINTLSEKLGLHIGYSDHTLGCVAPLVAISKGAILIEKHFTLNKKSKGPDHLASLNPSEFQEMVIKIRKFESMIGDGIKRLQKCELKNIKLVRKSIVARKSIKKNEIFKIENLTVKRPGDGLSPFLIKRFINKKAKKDYYKDDFIKF